jgi:predicted RNA-binding Zn-ribbon protein involved in translation (DUF1610 family)
MNKIGEYHNGNVEEIVDEIIDWDNKGNQNRLEVFKKYVDKYQPNVSADELNAYWDENSGKIVCIYEDAYETQARDQVKFKGKNLALGLESTIFICPKCAEIGKLHSQDDRFFCDCGFEAKYDVYGYLTDSEGIQYTVTELDKLQQEKLQKKVENWVADKPLFEDQVTIYRIGADHELIGTEVGRFSAYLDHLECGGETLKYDEIEGMAIYSRNAMIIHHPSVEGHLEVKSGIGFNALKYLYLYQFESDK